MINAVFTRLIMLAVFCCDEGYIFCFHLVPEHDSDHINGLNVNISSH